MVEYKPVNFHMFWQRCYVSDWLLLRIPAEMQLVCLFITHHLKWLKWKAYDGTKSFLINSHHNYIFPYLNTFSDSLPSFPLTPLLSPPCLPTSLSPSFSFFFFHKLGKPAGLMRFSRGPAHGNVSLVHIQLEVKKDMNHRKLDLGFSHIALYSFTFFRVLYPKKNPCP